MKVSANSGLNQPTFEQPASGDNFLAVPCTTDSNFTFRFGSCRLKRFTNAQLTSQIPHKSTPQQKDIHTCHVFVLSHLTSLHCLTGKTIEEKHSFMLTIKRPQFSTVIGDLVVSWDPTIIKTPAQLKPVSLLLMKI